MLRHYDFVSHIALGRTQGPWRLRATRYGLCTLSDVCFPLFSLDCEAASDLLLCHCELPAFPSCFSFFSI